MSPRPLRFLRRLWGTRKAPCRSFRLRCRIVWSTTWRHCWSYAKLAEDLGEGRMPVEPLRDGASGQADRPDAMRIVAWRQVAAHVWEVTTESAKYGRVTRRVLVLPDWIADAWADPAGRLGG